MLKRWLVSVCVLFGCAAGTGCNPEVAPPQQSEFQGEDQQKQMEAMEAVGKEGAAGATPVAQ